MRAAALSAHPGPAPAPPRERAAARRPPSRVGYPADRPLLSSPFAEVMEIKHGRAAMLGFLHVILIEAGVRFPTEQCEAAPAGLIASLESMPTFAWLQIMLICCMAETGWGGRSDGIVSQFGFGEAQTTEKEPGDIGGRAWIRYDEPGEKAFKLNAERNNGRAAMLGITGCLLHEIVGVDALYPTGGFGGDAPREIIDQATAFSGFPSFS